MRQSRFTDEQIAGMVREVEASATAAEVCRRHGVSKEMLRRWRSKYGGLELREARRLKAPEEESRRLVDDHALDLSLLHDVVERRWRTRECPMIAVDHSLPAVRVIEELEHPAGTRGLPGVIVCDNASEFTSRAFDVWAYRQGIERFVIRPGRPAENALIESFNSRLCDECLSPSCFLDRAAPGRRPRRGGATTITATRAADSEA